MTGYELSRAWFSWTFENPEKINPNHTALYFYILDLHNSLGWKEKFGLPSGHAMESIGIKSYKTYSKTLSDLIEFGFIEMVEKSKNQYTSNIIALVKNTKALTEALTKARSKHLPKQGQSTYQSNSTIDKPITNNLEPKTNNGSPPDLDEEKKINPEPTPDSETVKKATAAVADLFGISEMNQAAHWMRIAAFCRQLESSGRIDHFRKQFKAYRSVKLKDGGKYLHSWQRYTGSPDESYDDGAWNEKDWQTELRRSRPEPEQVTVSSASLSQRLAERNRILREEAEFFERQKKNRQNGTEPDNRGHPAHRADARNEKGPAPVRH